MAAITSFISTQLSTTYTSIVDETGTYISLQWESILEWASQSHIYYPLLGWVVTFTLVTWAILSLGFGPAGIAAGSIAAAFQSVAYNNFTPAGGVFAMLTSMGMLGALNPAAVSRAMVLATGVAMVMYLCGVGR